MDALPPSKAHELSSDLRIVQEAIQAGVTTKRANKLDKYWDVWDEFCIDNNIDPFL